MKSWCKSRIPTTWLGRDCHADYRCSNSSTLAVVGCDCELGHGTSKPLKRKYHTVSSRSVTVVSQIDKRGHSYFKRYGPHSSSRGNAASGLHPTVFRIIRSSLQQSNVGITCAKIHLIRDITRYQCCPKSHRSWFEHAALLYDGGNACRVSKDAS